MLDSDPFTSLLKTTGVLGTGALDALKRGTEKRRSENGEKTLKDKEKGKRVEGGREDGKTEGKKEGRKGGRESGRKGKIKGNPITLCPILRMIE
jgi:hypothetical protein